MLKITLLIGNELKDLKDTMSFGAWRAEDEQPGSRAAGP